jgi:phosphomannomutase
MNRYTVRRATQGVVAWLHELGLDPSRGVVVGRDGRHGSEAFNDEVVAVLLGAGVRVYEMPGPLPTPLVAYSVKALKAVAGIMITASHNPAQDNGFKLYAADGAQIIPPHDANGRALRQRGHDAGARELGRVRCTHVVAGIVGRLSTPLRGTFWRALRQRVRVTYTPLHGVGGVPMMELLTSAGFSAVTPVGVAVRARRRLSHPGLPQPGRAGRPGPSDRHRGQEFVNIGDRQRPRR